VNIYKRGSQQSGLVPAGVLKDWNAVFHGPAPADRVRVDVEPSDERYCAGVWSVEVGEFDLTYGATEFVTILSGRVVVSQADVLHELSPGDSFFTVKGETVHWKVLEPLTKAFLAIE